MYYRLSYENKKEIEIKELSTNRDNAVLKAWALLAKHNQIGQVIIERRVSEYYGDYEHCLTISKIKPELISQIRNNGLADICYMGNSSRRWSSELNPFKEYMLDKEGSEVRRLIWICQVKKMMFHGSPIRKEYNAKRDEQVRIIKSQGKTYEEIAVLANKYECYGELVFN